MLEIRKAQRHKAKLRMALIGTSGSGKTYSALQLAFGLGKKIGFIDTEHGSGDLYADLGSYDIISLEPPFTVAKYREAIRAFENADYDTIIIDSLTHAWAGEGGLLDKAGQLESSGRYKNSYAAFREITPEQTKLIEEMLQSPAHIIATMRSKTEYVLEMNDKGKQVPRKIGLAPVQRDGMEYEFTVVMDINDSHYARATKDRTMIFDGWSDRISPETGKKLLEWLEKGIIAEPKKDELTDRVQGFNDALKKCTNKKQIAALAANNGKLLLWIKEQNASEYEKLMKETATYSEAFDLAEVT